MRLSLVSRGCLLSVDEGNRRGTQAKARAMQVGGDRAGRSRRVLCVHWLVVMSVCVGG